MKLHTMTHLRRSELVEWLEGLGFTAAKVDGLIRSGVIPKKHIPHRRRKRSAGKAPSKSRSSKDPKLISGRAYYVAGKVAEALGITL
jgi:hypothetical protein